MNKRNLAILTATAFAVSQPGTATPAATATAAKAKGGAPKAEDRVAPIFAAVRADVAIPSNGRSKVNPYQGECDKLETIGASFGLPNKTKKQINPQISKINNAEANQRGKVDVVGNPVLKEVKAAVRDQAGDIVTPAVMEQEKERVKEFEVHDVNPATDPDKATVRVWRVK